LHRWIHSNQAIWRWPIAASLLHAAGTLVNEKSRLFRLHARRRSAPGNGGKPLPLSPLEETAKLGIVICLWPVAAHGSGTAGADLRYSLHRPDTTRSLTLVTTCWMLNVSAEQLQPCSCQTWQIELMVSRYQNLHGMEVLRCQSQK
jgi:hypothetical protein